jgi:hypothetical protein
VAEWFKAPVLKTGVPARVPWVRIPPLPPKYHKNQTLNQVGVTERTNERTIAVLSELEKVLLNACRIALRQLEYDSDDKTPSMVPHGRAEEVDCAG